MKEVVVDVAAREEDGIVWAKVEDVVTLLSNVIRVEREACALVCEQAGIDGLGTLAAAAMIRQRSSLHD